jgi:hypothetical protein
LLEVLTMTDDQRPATGRGDHFDPHPGLFLPPDRDFFVPPPADIGPVLSAHSTLKKGARPLGPGPRIAVIVVIAAVGAALLLLGYHYVEAPRDWFAQLAVGGLGGALGGLGGWAATRLQGQCTYVGRAGVARFVCAGRRDQIVKAEVFLFQNAVHLDSVATEHYSQAGVYKWTDYRLSWSDKQGHVIFEIKGRYHRRVNRGRDGRHTPVFAHYCWGVGASEAWNDHFAVRFGEDN